MTFSYGREVVRVHHPFPAQPHPAPRHQRGQQRKSGNHLLAVWIIGQEIYLALRLSDLENQINQHLEGQVSTKQNCSYFYSSLCTECRGLWFSSAVRMTRCKSRIEWAEWIMSVGSNLHVLDCSWPSRPTYSRLECHSLRDYICA